LTLIVRKAPFTDVKVVAFPLTANISHLPEKGGKQNSFLLHPIARPRPYADTAYPTATEESHHDT
jgi:hypothetical protein